MNNRLTTILVAILVGVAVYYFTPKTQLVLPFPQTSPVDLKSSLTCTSIVGSSIYGGFKAEQDSRKIKAEVYNGTEIITVTLKDEKTFNFVTLTSLEAGQISSNNWAVLQNNEHTLIASLDIFMPSGNSSDMFYLNKDNGMGLWIKSRATNPFSDSPGTESNFVHCM